MSAQPSEPDEGGRQKVVQAGEIVGEVYLMPSGPNAGKYRAEHGAERNRNNSLLDASGNIRWFNNIGQAISAILQAYRNEIRRGDQR